MKEESCDDLSDWLEAGNLNVDGIGIEGNGKFISDLFETEGVNDGESEEELENGRLNLDDEKGALVIEKLLERGTESPDCNVF